MAITIVRNNVAMGVKKRVIPLILFDDWKMVKTINFSTIRNYGSPVVSAKVYNAQKVDELIYLDIRASLNMQQPDFDAISDIVRQCFMPVTIGGGVRTVEQAQKLFKIGADKVAINSSAIENPNLIKDIAYTFGSQSVVISIDVRKIGRSYEVFTYSGTKPTGMSAFDWARKAEDLGAGEILINSIDNDGMMEGYDLNLLSQMYKSVRLPVIAAGGAGHPQHLVDAIAEANVSAVAVGSLFLYTEYNSITSKKYMKDNKIDVRTSS